MIPSLLPPECDRIPFAFYFGTFNPIHNGHLMIAQSVLDIFDFEKIVFIPAGVPPIRRNEPDMMDAAHRLRMVELAIADNEGFSVDPLELQREGPSYTVDTLDLLREKYELGDACIPVIIGSDALAGLSRWHRARDIAAQVCFLQAPRPGQPDVSSLEAEGEFIPLSTIRIDMPEMGISSSIVRQWIRDSRSVRYVIPQVVQDYILENRLLVQRSHSAT